MLEIAIIGFILYTIGIVIWALNDLPRYVREKEKRGKRDDYWRF